MGGKGYLENLRHEGNGNGEEEQRRHSDKPRDRSAQPATAADEGSKEGDRLKEQRDEEEGPSEAPHVEVVEARGATAVAADQLVGGPRGVRRPGAADGRVGPRAAAVGVVLAADAEEGPLRDVPGAGDAGGVGAEEVDFVEGSDVRYGGEDDEPEHDEGAGNEEEGHEPEGRTCRTPWLVIGTALKFEVYATYELHPYCSNSSREPIYVEWCPQHGGWEGWILLPDQIVVSRTWSGR